MAENTLAENIAEAIELIDNNREVIEDALTTGEVLIPKGTSKIRMYAFAYCGYYSNIY